MAYNDGLPEDFRLSPVTSTDDLAPADDFRITAKTYTSEVVKNVAKLTTDQLRFIVVSTRSTTLLNAALSEIRDRGENMSVWED